MLYSRIIGMPVFASDSSRPICSVQDLILDPLSGAVIAFVVGRGLIVTPSDVLSIKHSVLVRSNDDVLEASDVLRVQKVIDDGMGIMGKKVITSEGKVLGKIVDMTIDDKALILNKIYTARVILGLLQHDSRIIPAKNIVEVRADSVVVKDDSGDVVEIEVEREAVGAVGA